VGVVTHLHGFVFFVFLQVDTVFVVVEIVFQLFVVVLVEVDRGCDDVVSGGRIHSATGSAGVREDQLFFIVFFVEDAARGLLLRVLVCVSVGLEDVFEMAVVFHRCPLWVIFVMPNGKMRAARNLATN